MRALILALGLIQELPTSEASVEEPDDPVFASECSDAQYRGFDFWLGQWDVVDTASGRKTGESVIERSSAGCSVLENWTPVGGATSNSLTLFNRRSARWEQIWIGVDGRRVDLKGGLVGGDMVLTGYWDDLGGPDRDGLVRVRWTPNPDQSVRQAGEVSQNHGLTWQPFFDYTYRAKAD